MKSEDLNDTIKIDTAPYGLLQFRNFTLDDIDWFKNTDIRLLPGLSLVIQLVFTHAIDPLLDIEDVKAWPEDFLYDVAIQWCEEVGVLISPEDRPPSFEGIKQAIYRYHAALSKDLDKIAQAAESMSQISHVAKSISQMSHVAESMSQISHVAESMSQISHVAESISQMSHVAESMSQISHVAKSISQMSHVAESMSQISHVAESISQMSHVAESMSQFPQALQQHIHKLALPDQKLIDAMAQINRIGISQLQTIYKISLIPDQIADSVRSLATLTSPAFNILLPEINVPIFDNLPSLPEIEGVLRNVGEADQAVTGEVAQASTGEANQASTGEADQALTEEADQVLTESGFGFTKHLWTTPFINGLISIDPKAQRDFVTNKMQSFTCSGPFNEEIQSLFQKSPILKPRQKVISQALSAHIRGEYFISIPALLAQVEGIIADELILKNLVSMYKGKLYLIVDGAFKLDRNGKKIEASGLKKLIDHSQFKTHEVLQGVAEIITASIMGDRNEVLHGRNMTYGTAQLSTQALFILLILSKDIANIEARQEP